MGFKTFDQDIAGLFLNSFSKNPFAKQSQVNISLTDLKLNFNFELIEEDEEKFRNFISNWFGVDEEVKNLSLEIDEDLKAMLLPNLPADLDLKISDKTIEFKSKSSLILQTALIKNDFEFATGSGKLFVKYSDPLRYELKIENPNDLVFYATSFGILTASERLDGLFKSLPQVATIELNVNGKSISGSIVLK